MDLLYDQKQSVINDDGYVDMIKDLQRHSFGGLRFATQEFHPPKYVHHQKRTSSDVWKKALHSDRVQWIIRQMVREEDRKEEDVIEEATSILKELAYTDHMTVVRMLGYALYTVVSQIYHDGVLINRDMVSKLADLVKHHPVVLMPSHRSYMDFLIVTLVCFYLQLPLPAIAAGMDFMSMKGIGSALRACGAFFMRRSFGSDRLYWALFTEYVHTIIINGDRPMEFFIEGTRSRTGKSLNPKFGLLSVIAEPYLKAQTFDVMIVPISISYDRLVEENLYAYELLGIPKPKESTSGLMKASSILNDNYGGVHLHFCEPISLRNYFGHLDRGIHACYPRYMLRLSNTEQQNMELLGYTLILRQQQNMIFTAWAAMAVVLSQHPQGISLDKFVLEMLWFRQILGKCRVAVIWPAGSMREIVLINLHRFQHVVHLQTHTDPRKADTIFVAGSKSKVKGSMKSSLLDSSVIEETVNHIMLGNYRNQMLHNFIRPALVSFSIHKLKQHEPTKQFIEPDVLKEDFTFLQQLLKKDFIFEPVKDSLDLNNGINFLVECGVITSQNGGLYHIEEHADRLLVFLRSTFTLFLSGYWMCCQFLLNMSPSNQLHALPSQIQRWIAGHLQTDGVQQEMLSLNLISNCVHALVDSKDLIVHKNGNQKVAVVNYTKLQKTANRIATFIRVPILVCKSSTVLSKSAKL